MTQPAHQEIILDGHDAARLVGVAPATIRSWARRYPDELPRRGTSPLGRTLYSWADVLATDAARRVDRLVSWMQHSSL
jgi:DNA-binding transcriptional MerR regulator